MTPPFCFPLLYMNVNKIKEINHALIIFLLLLILKNCLTNIYFNLFYTLFDNYLKNCFKKFKNLDQQLLPFNLD